MDTQTTTARFAFCNGTPEQIAPYMPRNYRVLGAGAYRVDSMDREVDVVVIVGYDHLGWTLDDYVLPRLASGLYFGREVDVIAALAALAAL